MTVPHPSRGLGPGFGRLFAANISSSLGDGIARTALPLLAARLTDDPLAISAVAALSLLPWLFFAIPSGIVVDRIDRRRALGIAQAVRVLLGLALVALVATGTLTIWWLYVVIFVYGAFETLYDGAVRAVVPSLVRAADLPRANGRIEAGEQVVQNFVAGPLTSALFAVAVVLPLGLNVAAFAFAGVLAILLPRAASGREHAADATAAGGSLADDAPWYRQFATGYRFIRSTPVLWKLWLVSSANGVFMSMSTATLVLWVLGPLQVPEAWFGVFMLAAAVGGLASSFAAAPLARRFGSGAVMASMMVLCAVATLAMGLVPIAWAGAVLFGISAGAVTIWNILVISLRQALIPRHLLGRAHGTWRTLLWGTMPLGSLLGGLLGRFGLGIPFVVGGGVALLIGLAYFRFLRGLPDPADAAILGRSGAPADIPLPGAEPSPEP